MKKSMFAALSFVGAVACAGREVPVGPDAPAPEDAAPQADGGGVEAGGGSTLRWYLSCGDPVCHVPDAGATDAGACAPASSACTTQGESCGDPTQNCGVVLVCEDHDPRAGSCPISSKRWKDGIDYLTDDALGRLHDETLAMRLATYRYKGPFVDPSDPSARHLGFIVEDQPQSLSVDRGHDRVDLYGYLSMAVATMQVQERELQTLKKQVEALQRTCAKKR